LDLRIAIAKGCEDLGDGARFSRLVTTEEHLEREHQNRDEYEIHHEVRFLLRLRCVLAHVNCLGHRVVAAGVKGVALRNSLESHPASLCESIPLHGLKGVLRAGRFEAADVREPVRRFLIAPNQEDAHSLSHRAVTLLNNVVSSSRFAE